MAMVSQQAHCITMLYTSSHTIVPVSQRPALSTTTKLHYHLRLQKDLSLTFIILAAYQSITQTHDTATVDFLRFISFFHANSSHLQLANEEHRCIDCTRAKSSYRVSKLSTSTRGGKLHDDISDRNWILIISAKTRREFVTQRGNYSSSRHDPQNFSNSRLSGLSKVRQSSKSRFRFHEKSSARTWHGFLFGSSIRPS